MKRIKVTAKDMLLVVHLVSLHPLIPPIKRIPPLPLQMPTSPSPV
jgi:hypothetical protein